MSGSFKSQIRPYADCICDRFATDTLPSICGQAEGPFGHTVLGLCFVCCLCCESLDSAGFHARIHSYLLSGRLAAGRGGCGALPSSRGSYLSVFTHVRYVLAAGGSQGYNVGCRQMQEGLNKEELVMSGGPCT
jgi:hypothetical protein